MAEDPRNGLNKPQERTPSPQSDGEYEPSADVLVHECDDEGTMEEEELMSNESADNDELDDLQKEGDMPIESLLAMYGYGAGSFIETDSHQDSLGSTSEEEILNKKDLTLDKDEVARDILHDNDDSETSLEDLIESVHTSSSLHLLRSFNSISHSQVYDDEKDEDYVPTLDDESWKKNIQVGDDYQVQIPDILSDQKLDERDINSMGQLLWTPDNIEESQVKKYLLDVQILLVQGGDSTPIPDPGLYRDNEQALFTLLQSEYNTERALTYGKLQPPCPDPSSKDPMRLWSEEECELFESGLRIYGKNFFNIQLNKLPSRSVGELVQFYYFWKKTERREAFTNRGRHEKKYPIKPGQTDYIGRFGDPLENAADDPELSPLRPDSDCECQPANSVKPPSPDSTTPTVQPDSSIDPFHIKRPCPDEVGDRLSNDIEEKRLKTDTLSTYNNGLGQIATEVGN